MRIFLLFFPVFFFCGLLHAQTVKVEYGGDPLPDKDRKKIDVFAFLKWKILDSLSARYAEPPTICI